MPDIIFYYAQVAAGIAALLFVGILFLFKSCYRKVPPGRVLVNNRVRDTYVNFQGGLVLPVVHKAELMDISLKTIEVDRRGVDGLICKDNIRADIKVTFFVRVNQTADDVRKVATAVGCERASHQETVEELFVAKFSEALKTVGYNMDFVSLYNQRDTFKSQIIEVIGEDLNGYHLEDAAIDYLEQTPKGSLDPDNILDAQGIQKITELTVDRHIATNERERFEEQELTRQNVTAQERILDLERQREEAKATQTREIETIRAQAEADVLVKKAVERERAEKARIKADENISLEDIERQRKLVVADKNRERAHLVETEKVRKDQRLEAIERERLEALQTIQKEKEVEVEKKAIADVIRDRVSVERGVAQEEEAIKDLRADAGASRDKRVAVVHAEAEAEQLLVKDIKDAEAKERAASHLAKERIITSEADLEAADKETKARIRRAEGVQAEVAASGLGEVKVKEADAIAREKLGMADVRVKEADADAIQKLGQAEATVTQDKLLAEAKGKEEQGMADVRVAQHNAIAIEKQGLAQALAVREKLTAEATGLSEKATAMKALDDAGRGHEEFRIQLEVDERLKRESIQANQRIAQYQSQILAEAFKNTKIDIVGGDGEFFDKFVNAVSWGKTVDGFVDKSDRAQTLLNGYLDGSESLPQDLKDVLSRPALNADSVQKLTVSALLGTLLKNSSSEEQEPIKKLLEAAKKLGLSDVSLGE
jgi:uncharacterized membrane protein YqiK